MADYWHNQAYYSGNQAVFFRYSLRNSVFPAQKHTVSCVETECFAMDDYIETLFERCQIPLFCVAEKCDVMYDVCDVKRHSLTDYNTDAYKNNDEMTLFLLKSLREKIFWPRK